MLKVEFDALKKVVYFIGHNDVNDDRGYSMSFPVQR